jgi:two-component system, OmpR family, response regulator ChvI
MVPPSSPASRGHIVVVDDDELFRESLTTNLTDTGYSTYAFEDGASAVRHLAYGAAADVVLLDWKMPGMTGIEVIQRMRSKKIETPVIFLTVLSDEIYEETGLLGGAVDFIEKSRSYSILLRRIELILSGQKSKIGGSATADRQSLVELGDLALRYDTRRANWKQKNVGLTLTEFNILSYLMQHTDRDVSYREIYDIVHGEGFIAGEGDVGYRTNVRAFIKRIRQKFRDIDPTFANIKNYPSFGYRWQNGSDR